MADQQTLPELVRAKYPGVYDGVSDADLDAKVRAKVPGVYDAIPQPAAFKATNTPPSPSMWERANTPLIPQIADAAHAIADHLDQPKLDRSETEAKIRGFLAGATTGAGDVAASFTSPIGLALTAAGLGPESKIAEAVPALKTMLNLPAVRTLQRAVQTGAGAAFAGHGAEQVATAPTLAGKAQGLVEMATGGIGIKAGLSDVQAAWAANRRTAAGAQSTLQLKQALPPSKSTPYTDAQFHQAMPYLDLEHAQEPITSVQGLRDAADTAVKGIEGHITALVQANPTDTIKTNPLAAVKAKLSKSVRGDALAAGLKELDDLKLDQPITVADADRIRKQLNAENTAILKKNSYDVATARAADPGFAAREAAAQSLRTGIYDALDARGAQGVQQLRQDEGAVIALRNAAERQIYAGDKTVGGTAQNSLTRKGAALAIRATPGIPAVVADPVARLIAPANLTRDALVEKAFANRVPAPAPKVPLLAPPTAATAPPVAPTAPPTAATAPPVAPTAPTGLPPAGLPPKLPAGALPAYRQPIITPPPADTSGVVQAGPAAKGMTVRDPKTGQWKTVYTSEPFVPPAVQRGIARQKVLTEQRMAELRAKFGGTQP